MFTVDDICGAMEKKWALELAMAGDNVGLIIGRRDAPAARVLCALDVTDAVINEAIETGAQMIVSHHSVIYGGVSKITGDTRLGRAILRLAENKIAAYAAHTNVDTGLGGTNCLLAKKLGLNNIAPLLLEDGDAPFHGRVGAVMTTTLGAFAAQTAKALGLPYVNYVGDASAKVEKVAVCSGAGCDEESFRRALAERCDTYVTGDVTYHKAHAAAELGLNLIDATHFGSEIIFAEAVREYLAGEMVGLDVAVSAVERNIFNNTGGLAAAQRRVKPAMTE